MWQWVDAHQPSRLEKAEAAAERDRVLSLSPDLFGGGSIYGEYDPVGFATLVEALDAPLGPPVVVPDDLDDPDAVEAAFDELDQERTPGWLPTTLAGGRMRVSSGTLQRLVDERGADLATVVLDDGGEVVGVGDRRYVPPDGAKHAIWARDTVVRDPDVTNLVPLGRAWHNRKTSKHWRVHRARDGTVTWTTAGTGG